jgi:3-hydroxyisobutyrate dehydrogenase-like beta-hydroxyacid dehydrogenase
MHGFFSRLEGFLTRYIDPTSGSGFSARILGTTLENWTPRMPNTNTPRLCFIGFGEAGQAIASGLRDTGIEAVAAWDILFPSADGARLKHAGETIGVRVANSAADAAHGADIIVSAVTAASSLEAARSVEPHLSGNPYFLDINSVSPGRKKETERLLGAKARYVDIAILAPIHPARHQTPLLLAGPHAAGVMPLLIDELDMRGAIAGDEVGQAAGLKMIRSVMIKGIEALTLECFLAARRAGIVDEVAASLTNNYPTLDWNKVIEYNIERMASHGVRRADEMDQVAETLRELGIEPLMATATSSRQREMGRLGSLPAIRTTLKEGRGAMLDAISAAATDHH